MRTTKQVLYLGTYERDYPRNTLMIAALRRAGFDVVELHASVWDGTIDKSALLASPLALLRLWLSLIKAYVTLLVRALRRVRHADLIMFGFIGQLDLLMLGPLLRLLGKPLVFNPLVTLTDTLVEDRGKFAPVSLAAHAIRLVDRLSLSLAGIVLVDTEENRDYLVEEFGLDAGRIHVVPVGADETLFSAASVCNKLDHPVGAAPCGRPGSLRTNDVVRDRGSQGGLPLQTVLFYGNMIPLQGVETIIRAAGLLTDEHIRFEIIGSGQTLGEARALADHVGATDIDWIERVPYAELPERIARADVVLGIFGTSAKAGRVVPNKVYQAMAMGAAIVTRDSSAHRALLVDGKSALLVPPGDPAALADAIRRLRDPELRRRLGEAARQRFVERASLGVQAEAVGAALEPIVDHASTQRTGSVPV